MSEEYPQWGFMLTGLRLSSMRSASYKRHLFLNEKETACGWRPKSDWTHYKFSAKPVVPGIYEVQSEMERGRMYRAEEFKKCKSCLRIENKDRPKEDGD